MEEIKKGIDLCNFGNKLNPNEIINIFNEMDVDKNDTDGSGKISFEEFCDMIKPGNEQEKKDLFILYKKFDTKNDGEIDFEEFVDGFNNIH